MSEDRRSRDQEQPPTWEPEPLQLPIEMPNRMPDEAPSDEREQRVWVIDLA